MKIIDILKVKDKGVCFEFFPPRTENSRQALENTLKVLLKYKPLYVSMTYGAAGSTREKTKEAVDMFLREKDLVVMPHLTCIGAKKEYIRRILDEYAAAGVENIMALRGDPPLEQDGFDAAAGDFHYAYELIAFIKKHYPNFCVGAAVYPEGHIEMSSLQEDMEKTKQKIDAGVDFCVTQMFFDNKYYFDFLDRLRKQGIDIPVLPGILPLTDIDKAKQFIAICRATIPRHIDAVLSGLRGNPCDMQKAGIDFTIEQCRGLIENGAGCLHFFTLNKPMVMTEILEGY